MNIFEKLNLAREKFHSLKLEKTGHNKFAGYKYFELGDFLIPALKVFKEVGLTAVVSFDKDVATMQIIDIANTDAPNYPVIKITSPMGSAALKGCHEVQNIGAVETYQRRYLWVAALEIVEHDALDSSEPIKPEAAKESKLGGSVGSQVLSSIKHPLTEDQKIQVENSLRHIIDAYEVGGPQGGFERLQQENFDDMQKIYLSTLMDSKVRNSIKAYSHEYHSKAKATA
jgi:hypothetical protein